nr:PREDICTED: elongation of very long chain fatty acids protein 7-like isoform X2 [Tribolium castaneum]|eukprot:XP_015840849.1 PREDICTED: elongation of very long chain fatty acids protein 7-like isoform X2 [Tribolium castaneum]
MNLLHLYNYYVTECGDPRVKNWFLVQTPVPTLIIIGVYFVLIYKLLPLYMQNKEPFKLTKIIFFYNLFQIICSAVLVYNFTTPLSDPAFALKCDFFTYNDSPKAQKRLMLSYYFHLLKIVELFETVFFVLRKKFNQVSVLHVYHHVTTMMITWLFTKYFAAFSQMLNSFVHFFMYCYYLVASLGPVWQQKIVKWKSTLTILQIAQLFVSILHSSQLILNPNCGMPPFAFCVYGPNVAVVICMFANFYRQNYLKQKKQP